MLARTLLLPRRLPTPTTTVTSRIVSLRSIHRSPLRLNEYPPEHPERAEDEVDCLIVGGGPAGLSAAIRFKQLEKERGGEEKRVVVLEKGAEVGESGWFESGVGKESRKRAQCGSSHWLEDASRRVMDLAGMGGVENQDAVLVRSVVHVEKKSGPCDCGKGIAGRRL
jgi:hypothetical protein